MRLRDAEAVVLIASDASLASKNVRQEIMLAWRYDKPIIPLILHPLVFPDDVAYWLEGSQWIEVLDREPSDWMPKLRQALARHGIAVGGDDPAARGAAGRSDRGCRESAGIVAADSGARARDRRRAEPAGEWADDHPDWTGRNRQDAAGPGGRPADRSVVCGRGLVSRSFLGAIGRPDPAVDCRHAGDRDRAWATGGGRDRRSGREPADPAHSGQSRADRRCWRSAGCAAIRGPCDDLADDQPVGDAASRGVGVCGAATGVARSEPASGAVGIAGEPGGAVIRQSRAGGECGFSTDGWQCAGSGGDLSPAGWVATGDRDCGGAHAYVATGRDSVADWEAGSIC